MNINTIKIQDLKKHNLLLKEFNEINKYFFESSNFFSLNKE